MIVILGSAQDYHNFNICLKTETSLRSWLFTFSQSKLDRNFIVPHFTRFWLCLLRCRNSDPTLEAALPLPAPSRNLQSLADFRREKTVQREQKDQNKWSKKVNKYLNLNSPVLLLDTAIPRHEVGGSIDRDGQVLSLFVRQ